MAIVAVMAVVAKCGPFATAAMRNRRRRAKQTAPASRAHSIIAANVATVLEMHPHHSAARKFSDDARFIVFGTVGRLARCLESGTRIELCRG
jgi:hypothetical protein